jgi:hypothetical protein
MKAALKRGVETGTLVMIKSSYKVSSDAKKPVKKAAAPKVAKAVVAKVRTRCLLYGLPRVVWRTHLTLL